VVGFDFIIIIIYYLISLFSFSFPGVVVWERLTFRVYHHDCLNFTVLDCKLWYLNNCKKNGYKLCEADTRNCSFFGGTLRGKPRLFGTDDSFKSYSLFFYVVLRGRVQKRSVVGDMESIM